MAISNVQTKTPVSLPLLAFITLFLMLLNQVNSSSDSLSFTFNNFKPDEEDLILQGDAQIPSSSEAILQLTKTDSSGNPVDRSVGRALYVAPLHLWDRTTGKAASFETFFTFVISSPTDNAGDGLAFFIAPPNTTIPPNSVGGYLGLFNSTSLIASNQVVAVEFDTYPDHWDPSYRHIGIDVNSIVSSSYRRWVWRTNETATAHISYNSATKLLSVVSSYPHGETVTVSYVIDLKTVLPEWVRIGFSGSTGDSKQTNNIHSWSFSSSLTSSKSKKEDMNIASYV